MKGTKCYDYKQNENKESKYGNYISVEINTEESNINGNIIRIINSNKEIDIEVEEHCIKIDYDENIKQFSYFYKYNKNGKFKLKCSFKKNIKNVSYMFYNCNYLTNIDLSNFNSQKVTNMSHMFYKCESLKNINFSNFNTQNVTDMSDMFYKCKSLTNIDLSNFNNQNVTNMSCMFYDCNSLTNLNLSNFNTQNVANMSYMFMIVIH